MGEGLVKFMAFVAPAILLLSWLAREPKRRPPPEKPQRGPQQLNFQRLI